MNYQLKDSQRVTVTVSWGKLCKVSFDYLIPSSENLKKIVEEAQVLARAHWPDCKINLIVISTEGESH